MILAAGGRKRAHVVIHGAVQGVGFRPVYTNQGVGRFTKLGIPFPGPTAHFVAMLEIVCGVLLIQVF
jgi:uncharacterized membrane protein YphA (DoxX/SURF4 family)